MSERTVRALIDRWVRAELVARRTLFVREHAVVADPGWTRAGAPIQFPHWERPGMFEHIFQSRECASRIAERLGATWISERILRAEAGGAVHPEHMPDGLVLRNGREIAVEVQIAGA